VPGLSGGIENVAYGLIQGLAKHLSDDESLTVVIPRGTEAAWRQELGDTDTKLNLVSTWSTASVGRRGGVISRVKAALRWSPLVRPVVNRLRHAGAARRVGAEIDAWLFPYHRMPVRVHPSVVVVHDLRVLQPEFEHEQEKRQLLDTIERASVIVTAWRHPAQMIADEVPAAARKLRVIPLPVLRPGKAPRSRSTDDGRIHLLYPAATSTHKNHDRLIEAMSLLPEHYMLTCPGPPIEPDFARLKTLVKSRGLLSRVDFPGYVTQQRLAQLYADADCVVLPTLWEAGSDPLLEAAFLGLPIACADIEPLRMQLEELGTAAAVFDPYNPADIADAIKNASSWGRQRRDNLPRLATWDSAAANFLDVLREVAEL
jgi:glycosyltransferase involved in cell wall biosynthesis